MSRYRNLIMARRPSLFQRGRFRARSANRNVGFSRPRTAACLVRSLAVRRVEQVHDDVHHRRTGRSAADNRPDDAAEILGSPVGVVEDCRVRDRRIPHSHPRAVKSEIPPRDVAGSEEANHAIISPASAGSVGNAGVPRPDSKSWPWLSNPGSVRSDRT